MGIPRYVAIAVSGLAFAGGAVLAAGPASAQAMTAPQHVIAGGAPGGAGPAPRPVAQRRVVVQRAPVTVRVRRPVHRRFCVSCRNHERFNDFERFHVREHRRAIIVNRNRNFSDSESDQFQRQRERQEEQRAANEAQAD